MRFLTIAALVLVAARAKAQEPGNLTALFTCQRRASLGRVVCEVEAEVTRGRLVWADVVITDASELARPLKSRVSMREATARLDKRIRLPVGLIALGFGEGSVTAEVRVVACGGEKSDEACVPMSRSVTAPLIVGPLVSP